MKAKNSYNSSKIQILKKKLNINTEIVLFI